MKALKAFEWMEKQKSRGDFDTHDTFLYTRLMTMFSRRSNDCSDALQIFESMQSRGIKPDLVAYNTAINAAGMLLSLCDSHVLLCFCLGKLKRHDLESGFLLMFEPGGNHYL